MEVRREGGRKRGRMYLRERNRRDERNTVMNRMCTRTRKGEGEGERERERGGEKEREREGGRERERETERGGNG